MPKGTARAVPFGFLSLTMFQANCHSEQSAKIKDELQTVIAVPSNLVNENPANGSLNVCFMSWSMLMVAASPSRLDAVASLRQCTPAMLRPCETLETTLFSSPPTVNGGSPAGATYGTNVCPPSARFGTTGFLTGCVSSNNAFNIVTQAPATVAWPEP